VLPAPACTTDPSGGYTLAPPPEPPVLPPALPSPPPADVIVFTDGEKTELLPLAPVPPAPIVTGNVAPDY
jgi:hypothetical protein